MRLILAEGNLTPQRTELLSQCANAAVETEGVAGEVIVYLHMTDDSGIRVINREYRDTDRATDVLSFPTINYPAGVTAGSCPERIQAEYDPDEKGPVLGDIFISAEHAEAQAEEYGHSTDREMGYLLVHGMFHLMGYDHMNEEEKARMRSMEEKALYKVGLTR